MLAARVIVAIDNPEDVIAISGRPYGQRAVLKFAQYTGTNYIAGRYTPGSLTNQIQKKFLEPRLLVVTDPGVDHQVHGVTALLGSASLYPWFCSHGARRPCVAPSSHLLLHRSLVTWCRSLRCLIVVSSAL